MEFGKKDLAVAALPLLIGGAVIYSLISQPECLDLPTAECSSSPQCLFSTALQDARAINKGVIRNVALARVARVQADAGYMAEALETVNDVREATERAIANSADAKSADEGENATANDKHWRDGTLTELAGILAKAGDWPGARELFGLVYSRPDPVLRAIAVEQIKAGDVAGARRTLRPIADKTYRESVWYHIALAESAAGDAAAALEAARNIPRDNLRDEVMLSVVHAQLRAGDFVAALQTAEQVGQKYWRRRDSAYAAIIAARARAGEMSKAFALLDKVETRFPRSQSLEDIAIAQARRGRIAAALRTVGRSRSDIALREIASAQLKNGDHAGAIETARSIYVKASRSLALLDIAAVQERAGDSPAARSTIAEALEAARTVLFLDERAKAMASVAHALAQAGDESGARDMFALAIDTARRADPTDDRAEVQDKWARRQVKALEAISRRQAESGFDTAARATMAEAVETTRNIRTDSERIAILTQLAEAQAELGETEAAIASFGRAVKTSLCHSDRFERVGYLAALAADLARSSFHRPR